MHTDAIPDLPPLPDTSALATREPQFINDKRLTHDEYGMETKLSNQEFTEKEWRGIATAELLSLLVNVFFWAIIIRVILSWVNPDPRHPAVGLLGELTEPVMRPAQRLLPPISGLDLSPILVLIALQLLNMLLIYPLRDFGVSLV